MYGAKELDRSRYGDIYSMTESLASQGNIPMPKLYMIVGDQPNAFATGRNPEHAAVAVTEGIVRILSRDELRGVIAHELAHIKHRDILVATIAATFAGAISMIANMAQWAYIFGGSRSNDDEGSNPAGAIAMMIVAPLAATLVQLAISRQREFLADEGGARMCGNPLSLSGALRKLHTASQQIPMHATPSTAHLFIVNPFTGGGLMKLFSTHPPMEERVARLESMVYGGS
jgi:heat shock protein HtpX